MRHMILYQTKLTHTPQSNY